MKKTKPGPAKGHPGWGGRPRGVEMSCSWGCGARLTAAEMRAHFTRCPRRPDLCSREKGSRRDRPPGKQSDPDWIQVSTYIQRLRSEISRRRKEVEVKSRGNWVPDQISKMDLIRILDWIENELDGFNSGQLVNR